MPEIVDLRYEAFVDQLVSRFEREVYPAKLSDHARALLRLTIDSWFSDVMFRRELREQFGSGDLDNETTKRNRYALAEALIISAAREGHLTRPLLNARRYVEPFLPEIPDDDDEPVIRVQHLLPALSEAGKTVAGLLNPRNKGFSRFVFTRSRP